MSWDQIPGTRSDDTVDAEQLLRWLDSARSLCRESGHLEIADLMIGEMKRQLRSGREGMSTSQLAISCLVFAPVIYIPLQPER
ncbi:MAG: hypothetical protein HUU20_03915 [Pirellulales bacterium]|nr:hypothetical protein [Pirellulales bacterium]